MGTGLTRYELRVATVLSRAALAAFQIHVTPTPVPRKTVYRFRIPADRDPTEVLSKLTEFDVQVLEIRRCFDVSSRERRRATPRPEAPPPAPAEPPAADTGVVVPFRARVHTPGFRPAPDAPHGGGSAG